MSTTRSFSPALLLALALFAGAGAARADQLEWVPRKDAERAAAALTPGTLFVQWISHQANSRPVIYCVESAEVKDVVSAGLAEISVKARKVGQTHTLRQPIMGPFKFDLAKTDAPATTFSVDLAYTYIASGELPGVFVNLGKKLSLECSVKVPAIEVGQATVAEFQKRFEAAAAATITGGGIVDRIPGE